MNISGAQIVAIAAWLSVLAAPWYALATGAPARDMAVVAGVAVFIGIVAGGLHQGQLVQKRREASAAVAELKRAAVERIRGGFGAGYGNGES